MISMSREDHGFHLKLSESAEKCTARVIGR